MATEERRTNSSELSTTNCIGRRHSTCDMNIPGLSLQTTDLIHEAYLRLIDQQHVGGRTDCISSESPRRLCGAFWWTMRGVDSSQTRWQRDSFAPRGGDGVLPGQDLDFVALDEALNKLAQSIRSRAR